MTSNRDRAAEILHRHHDNCNAAADALDAVGVLADDLPEPSFYAHGNQDKPMWDTGNHFRADALDAPQVALSKAGNVWKMNPDEAHALALALFAAAAHAQKEETNE